MRTTHNLSVADEFGGLLDSFTLALEAEGKSPKTVENYSRAVVAFARGCTRTTWPTT